MKVFIAGTFKCETPQRMAVMLKDSEAGYQFPSNREEYFIVSYGRPHINAHLNKNLITDKLEAMKVLSRNGVRVPEIYDIRSIESLPRNVFPLLARKIKHARGTDAMFLKTKRSAYKRWKRVQKRDFLVKYIDKVAEYRVHVLGNNVVNVSKKIPSSEAMESPHSRIWSSERGWTLDTYEDSIQWMERNSSKVSKLKEIGLKAVKALQYDFGAVDVIEDRNGLLYVLEVNSAPCLCRERRRLYIKFFREKELEYSRRV